MYLSAIRIALITMARFTVESWGDPTDTRCCVITQSYADNADSKSATSHSDQQRDEGVVLRESVGWLAVRREMAVLCTELNPLQRSTSSSGRDAVCNFGDVTPSVKCGKRTPWIGVISAGSKLVVPVAGGFSCIGLSGHACGDSAGLTLPSRSKLASSPVLAIQSSWTVAPGESAVMSGVAEPLFTVPSC